MKLLYFLDFRHFRQTGRSVTGLQYQAWEFGPVPKQLFTELSGKMPSDMANSIQVIPKGDFIQIVSKKPFREELFSRRELKIMDDLVFILKDTNAEDMIESTHLRHTPWDKTFREKGQYSLIDYMLILDDQPDSVSYEDAHEEITDREEMIQAFGGC